MVRKDRDMRFDVGISGWSLDVCGYAHKAYMALWLEGDDIWSVQDMEENQTVGAAAILQINVS